MEKEAIIECFTEQFKLLNLSKKSRNNYIEKTNFGHWRVNLGFSEEIYGIELEIYISLRIDRLEEIIQNFPLYPNAKTKTISTCNINLGYLVTGKPEKWIFESNRHEDIRSLFLKARDFVGLDKVDIETNVEKTVREIVVSIEKFAKPFIFQATSSFETVFSLLCNSTGIMRQSIYLENILAKRLVAIAFLMKKRYLFDQLVDEQRALILDKYDFDIENFDDLVNYLRAQFG